ncbi:hypothetical protein EPN95_01180 [Patescibacteria group bacterium]|nr:MAG: hypothetical protein EPN95_01180 [Patescibacteria group bacterium]
MTNEHDSEHTTPSVQGQIDAMEIQDLNIRRMTFALGKPEMKGWLFIMGVIDEQDAGPGFSRNAQGVPVLGPEAIQSMNMQVIRLHDEDDKEAI